MYRTINMCVLAGTPDYPPYEEPKDVFRLKFWFEGFLWFCKQKGLDIVKLWKARTFLRIFLNLTLVFIFSSVGKPEFLYSSYLHVGPPLVSCHLPQATIYQKHQNFPCQTIAVRSSRQWPQPNFFAMRGLEFSIVFTLL